MPFNADLIKFVMHAVLITKSCLAYSVISKSLIIHEDFYQNTIGMIGR